jgi:hypothetical protein
MAPGLRLPQQDAAGADRQLYRGCAAVISPNRQSVSGWPRSFLQMRVNTNRRSELH